ncbi:RNA polymerase sigma-70 factor [Puteibacter caeruleilacunae]|nr:RNA polymerase sigma-70 factor [Puteibacter caeruleilacunae]
MKPNDQLIIQKLRKRDESGLKQMFDSYYTPMCICAYNYLDNFDQAEDLVQEIFIGFWENQRINHLTSSLKSYLFTSVRNNALQRVKKSNQFKIIEIDDDFDMLEENCMDPEELETKKQIVYNEIENLPEQCRKVFELIVFDNYKYKEVAVDLNISVNTVKTYFSRSLKHLRTSVGLSIIYVLFGS